MDNYPEDISTFRTRQNLPNQPYDETKLTTIYNEDLTRIESELVAVETVLGIEPQAGFTTVADRISALETYITNIKNAGLPTNLLDNGTLRTSIGVAGDSWFVFDCTASVEYYPATDGIIDNRAIRLTPSAIYGGMGQVFYRPQYNFPVAGSQFRLVVRYKTNGTGSDIVANMQEDGDDYTLYGQLTLDSPTWTIEEATCTVPSGHGTDNGQGVSVVVILNGSTTGKSVDIDWIALVPLSDDIPQYPYENYRASRTI